MYQRSRKSMGEAKTALIGSGDFAEQVADLGRESEIEVVGMFDGNRPKRFSCSRHSCAWQ